MRVPSCRSSFCDHYPPVDLQALEHFICLLTFSSDLVKHASFSEFKRVVHNDLPDVFCRLGCPYSQQPLPSQAEHPR